MSRIRSLARRAFATALVAGSFAGSFAVELTPAHADLPPLQFNTNLVCNTLTMEVGLFNNTAVQTTASVELQTSLQTTTKSATVPALGYFTLEFPVVIGERLDKLILRDASQTTVATIFTAQVITGTGECTRPAFELVEMTGYSLTCVAGLTHAVITVENNGDYPADMYAEGRASFPTDAEYQDALQQGLVTTDSETFTLPQGQDTTVELSFKVVAAMIVELFEGQTELFVDGPRTPVPGEGCTPSEPEPTVPEPTVPEPTVPETTAPEPETTAPETTAPVTLAPESPVTTITPETTLAAPAPAAPTAPTTTAPATDSGARTLPSTGRSSLPTGLIGTLMFTAGLGLVRITRRRQA